MPRSLPQKTLPKIGGNKKKQEEHEEYRQKGAKAAEERDLIAVFPVPTRGLAPVGCAITNGSRNTSGTSSIGDDSVSSSTTSLPLSPSYALAATVEPLRLRRTTPSGVENPPGQLNSQQGDHRPRPDSLVLTDSSPPLQRPSPLHARNFAALVRKGDDLQYWLSVDLVLQGIPGRACVPRGHWDRLVSLAEAVRVSSSTASGETRGRRDKKISKPGVKAEQLITGWCKVDELMEGVGDEPGSS